MLRRTEMARLRSAIPPLWQSANLVVRTDVCGDFLFIAREMFAHARQQFGRLNFDLYSTRHAFSERKRLPFPVSPSFSTSINQRELENFFLQVSNPNISMRI